MNSKRDYEAMAKILKDLKLSEVEVPEQAFNMALAHVAYKYADIAVERNPRFDRQRFYQASGIS